MVTDDDFKFNDEFEEGLEDLDNMSAEELAEWDKAATKIQSAHRGRKARTCLLYTSPSPRDRG